MPPPPTPLSLSLSLGNPYTSFSNIPPPPPPKAPPSSLSLFQTLLPLLQLSSLPLPPSQLSHLQTLLSALLARIHLLPPHLHSSQSLTLPPNIRDDVNTALAQSACADVADFVDSWNELAPSKFTAGEVDEVAGKVNYMRNELAELKKQGGMLEAQIRETRASAVAIYTRAVEGAVEAVEIDVGERMVDNGGADGARVDMLACKGRATGAKLRLQRAEIAGVVYEVENVRALGRVAREIERRLAEAEREIGKGEKRLREIRGMGKGFEEVVEEIGKLKEVLEEKVWERDQLVGTEKRGKLLER